MGTVPAERVSIWGKGISLKSLHYVNWAHVVLQKRMGFFPPRGELSLNSSADITWVAVKPEDSHCDALLCYSLGNRSVTT